MKPIKDDLSLRKQTMFFVELESENCLSTELKRSFWVVWQTIAILRHEHLQALLLESDFCQG